MKRMRDDSENDDDKVPPKETKKVHRCDELPDGETTMTFPLMNPRHKKHLKLLIRSGRYCKCVLLRILNYQEMLDLIDSIGMEKFSLLLHRDGAELNTENTNPYWMYVFYHMLFHSNIREAINMMTVEKLHTMFFTRNKSFDYWIPYLLSNRATVNCIINLDNDKFKAILQNEGFGGIELVNLLRESRVTILNRLSTEKVKMLTKYYQSSWCKMLSLLSNASIVNFIQSIDLQKFGILLELFPLLYYEGFNSLCRSDVNSINGISTEKLMFLTSTNYYKSFRHRFISLINHPNQLNLINSISIEDLKVMFSVMREFDIDNLLNNSNFDVRKNLSFAVALYKRGIISHITSEYIENSDVLYEDVIRVFPNSFPIGKILQLPSNTDTQTLVPKLKDRCIAVYVGHTKPNTT